MPAKPRRPRPLPPRDPAHADAAIVHLAPQARATEARQRAFLAELERTGRVVDAAHAAGLTTSTVYRLRDRSDAFAAAWDHARAHCYERVEEAAFERAVEGVEVPVYYRDQVVGTRRKYSDTLALAIMRRTKNATDSVERERLRAQVEEELREAGRLTDPEAEERKSRYWRDKLNALMDAKIRRIHIGALEAYAEGEPDASWRHIVIADIYASRVLPDDTHDPAYIRECKARATAANAAGKPFESVLPEGYCDEPISADDDKVKAEFAEREAAEQAEWAAADKREEKRRGPRVSW